MLKIQGKTIDNVASKKVTIVRTYKGDIKRTNAGVVSGYPLSFITVGISVSILDTKDKIRTIQQLLLSDNTLSVQSDHNGVDFLGAFSVTSQSIEELRDKTESKSMLTIEFVNHGTAITKPDGTLFKVMNGTTQLMTASFAQIVTVSGYKLDGATLPNNKLMVLGDVQLTPAS